MLLNGVLMLYVDKAKSKGNGLDVSGMSLTKVINYWFCYVLSVIKKFLLGHNFQLKWVLYWLIFQRVR